MHHLLTAAILVLSTQGVSALRCANEGSLSEPMPALANIVAAEAENVTIDVYFHIASTEANKDRITDHIVAEQVCAKHPAGKHLTCF